ncbi:MAG: hypothetical protein ACRCTZ_06805 [Sarcina sp.]
MTICNTLENCFVVPSNLGEELIILTDEEMNYGVMNINSDTVALSSDAVKLLNEAFIVNYPSKVTQLNPSGDSVINNLLEDLASSRIIGLSPVTPPVESIIDYIVSPGEVINKNSDSGIVSDEVIIAEYPGRVFCIKIGSIRIYIYFSETSLLDINCTPTIEGYNCILDFGSLGTTIFPTPVKAALGANCSVCGACGGCGACGACALCGGLNFGAAAIALVAVDAALAITGALSAFAVSRPQQ